MAFKRNLPFVSALALLAIGLIGLAVYFKKPDEVLIHEAAAAYGATLGQAKDVVVHGTVADIQFHGKPTLYAEFVKQDGRWVYSKDLGAEFERTMKDPAVGTAILKNLAQRIADRFAISANISNPAFSYQYVVSRKSDDLLGEAFVFFNYPPQNGKQMHGCYREVFRFVGGTWKSEGLGALFDRLPAPRQ